MTLRPTENKKLLTARTHHFLKSDGEFSLCQWWMDVTQWKQISFIKTFQVLFSDRINPFHFLFRKKINVWKTPESLNILK